MILAGKRSDQIFAKTSWVNKDQLEDKKASIYSNQRI
jgi:hypothetical protein